MPAEAIKRAGRLMAAHLTLLFNMCPCHSYIPIDLTQTTLVSLLKNKSGEVNDINNLQSHCVIYLFE